MSVMFANSRANQVNNGYLVEFKAGRSNLQAGSTVEKRKVVADKTKGLIFIKQSNDQLMHFCWKNRETGAVVDDLIIFPGDTEFVRVKECTDGRVYMLKFKSTDERRLFWMQDGKTDKDEENCKKVNDTLNNPPAPRAAARGGTDRTGAASFGSLAALSGAGADSELGALGNLDQSQLMQLLSLMNHSGGSSASDATSLLPQLPLITDPSTLPQRLQLMRNIRAAVNRRRGIVARRKNSGEISGTTSERPRQGHSFGIRLRDLAQLMQIFRDSEYYWRQSSEHPMISRVASEESGAASTQVATPSNTPANGTVTGGSSTNAVQLSQLKEIIASITPPNGSRRKSCVPAAIDFTDVLCCADKINDILCKYAERLIPHLPNQEPVYTKQEELEQTLRTPQFRQAVGVFGHALQSGQLAPVLRQFGIDANTAAAAGSGDMVAWAKQFTTTEGGKESTPKAETSTAHVVTESEVEDEETNETAIREAEQKKNTEDNMDLD